MVGVIEAIGGLVVFGLSVAYWIFGPREFENAPNPWLRNWIKGWIMTAAFVAGAFGLGLAIAGFLGGVRLSP